MPDPNQKNPDLLQKRLIQRFHDDKLAHFYLLRPHPQESNPQEALQSWVNHLLEQIWLTHRSETSHSFTQHPDFLIIENPKPARAYQSKENPGLMEWAKTQDYGPMELKRRWIVVHHAHTLTESFCNKHLKTLEEPNPDTTLIFTDPKQAPLLHTIESRAINIQIPRALNPRELARSSSHQSFTAYLRSVPQNGPEQINAEVPQELAQALEGPLHEALEWVRSHPELEQNILEWLLDFERSRSQAPQLNAVLQRLKWFQKSALLHNSAQERWLTLLSPYLPHQAKL